MDRDVPGDRRAPIEGDRPGRPVGDRSGRPGRVSNAPTEATNDVIKRIKRVGFRFKKFARYRVPVLL